MKLSRTAKYGITGIGLVVLACIGLTLFALSGSKKIGPVVDPNACEYCGGKLNKSGDCPKCISEMGLDKYRAKRESKYWYNSPFIATLVMGVLSVLVMIHLSILLLKHYRRGKRDDIYHIFCPKCRRKLRYRSSQINHMGRCPLCETPIRFPEPIEAPRPSVWGKMRGLSWRKIWSMVWD